jgi:hypothetical protein
MPSALQLLSFIATAGLLVAFSGSPKQDPTSNKKPYFRTGLEATLSGRVTFDGKPPKPRIIDMSADFICHQSNRKPETDWFLVTDKGIANVVVYLEDGAALSEYSFEIPDSSVVLKHKNCRYEPHVLGMRAGQPLVIENSDDTHHNTHPDSKLNDEWNQTQAPGAPPIVKTYKNPEVAVRFRDNQHPWERAYVAVFTHPYFAVSDQNGNYKIEGVPPGRYRLVAWHEEMGKKTLDLVLVPNESRDLGFTFGREDIKDSRLLIDY